MSPRAEVASCAIHMWSRSFWNACLSWNTTPIFRESAELLTTYTHQTTTRNVLIAWLTHDAKAGNTTIQLPAASLCHVVEYGHWIQITYKDPYSWNHHCIYQSNLYHQGKHFYPFKLPMKAPTLTPTIHMDTCRVNRESKTTRRDRHTARWCQRIFMRTAQRSSQTVSKQS